MPSLKPGVKQTLQFARARDWRDPYRDAQSDLWRVKWKDFGFPFYTVYLIGPRGGWPTKIGISDCAWRRMLDLQTAHWQEMVVHRTWIVENRTAARKVEAEAHRMLQDGGGQLLGEWYDIRPDKASEIVQFAAEKLAVETTQELPNIPKFAPVMEWIEKMKFKDVDRHLVVFKAGAKMALDIGP